MTKLANVRVVLAVDDDVDLKDLKPRLQAVIANAGTVHIGEDGKGGARIHFGTADVLQGPDQRPGAVGRRGGKKTGTAASPQADLIQ